MAVPKRRTTRSKRAMRRAHHDKVTAPTIVPCPRCQAMMIPHRVCENCGYYAGRDVLQKREEEADG